MVLAPYRVIDCSGKDGLLGGQLLADLGADGIAVEPPGNLDTRRDGYNLRCVFLGSKAALSLNGLELLVRSP